MENSKTGLQDILKSYKFDIRIIKFIIIVGASRNGRHDITL